MFFMGLGILVAVPAFKTVTHLPPFMGILFGLGLLWLVGDLVHKGKEDDAKEHFTLVHALTKIDMGSIVFFHRHLARCGVAGAQPHSDDGCQWLDQAVGRQDVIVTIIGMVSAIVDNVPLVAASMGMYSLTTVSCRQLSVGIHGLLRRHRRLDSDHRLGRRGGRHGAGEDRLYLVLEKNQLAGCLGLLCGSRVFTFWCTRCRTAKHQASPASSLVGLKIGLQVRQRNAASTLIRVKRIDQRTQITVQIGQGVGVELGQRARQHPLKRPWNVGKRRLPGGRNA
jgi:hypothetical protein